jgi:uncharacterized protein HemY
MLASDDKRLSDARQFLEKALQLDPSSPTALRQLGELELAAGDFAKAAAHLKRACELRPYDSTAAFEWGEAAEKSGDWAGARDALELGLKQAPGQTAARLELGSVYLQLKDPKKAEDQFEAALLVDSNNSEGGWDWRKRRFCNPILPGPYPIWRRSLRVIREMRRAALAGASLSRAGT